MELLKNENGYTLNKKNLCSIKAIEALTQGEAEFLISQLGGEIISVKEHECYLVDLSGYFRYSILIFRNGRHIYYANDYQLHHPQKTQTELKEGYIERANKVLFTDEELMGPVNSYDEYTHKDYFVRNYWIMGYDHLSMWFIGKVDEARKEALKKMPLLNPVCFCYVADNGLVKQAFKYEDNLKKGFKELKKSADNFRKMISYELSNYEACITGSADDALSALDLTWKDLTNEQQNIVKDELKRQTDAYRRSDDL